MESLKTKRSGKKIDKTLILLLVLVAIAVGAAVMTGGWTMALDGLLTAGHNIQDIWVRLLIGFALAGLIQVILPGRLIAKWLGPASGLKGMLIATGTGTVMAGGPYVILPIIASIYEAGAGVGPIIALLVAHSLIDIQMLVVWQIPFLGLKLPIARYIAGLAIPPLAGLAGNLVFNIMSGKKAAKIAGFNVRNNIRSQSVNDVDGVGETDK